MPSENGKVPVTFLKGHGNHFAGETAGFTPDLAHELVAKGAAVYFDPAADDPKYVPPAEPAGEDDDDKKDGDGAPAVEIPEGWQALHGNARKSLAAKIAGAPVVSVDEADQVIAAEVTRRADTPAS